MDRTTAQHIVIAGGGTAGWMAAAALSRFTTSRITLVEAEEIGPVGVGEATIPQIRLFNAGLGIDEAEFLRETKGSFKLGIEFAGWAGEGTRYMHAFGPVGHPAGLLPFHQYWLRAREEGFAEELGAYSLNETAARALKMQMWRPEPGKPAPDMPWAYHFDAGLYAAFLRRYAEARGVTRIAGKIVDVEAGERAIASLTLDDGSKVGGDFFLDCTGFRSLLLGEALGTRFEDWQHWLPCDRAVAVPCATRGDFTPYTTATARRAGWQWRIPLQHRIGNGLVYSSADLSDDEALDMLLGGLDGPEEGEPNRLRFATGTRAEHWVGNCLAMGLSAGFMEPLESTSIHLIQASLSRFLTMLPDGRPDPAIVREFNRQTSFEWERIRDFLILHYKANGRQGEAFWDRCRAMSVPDSLAEKIEQFEATGYIHREHEELFTQEGWLQVFVGQGVTPSTFHPIAGNMSQGDLAAMMSRITDRNRETVARMPDHVQFLRAFCMPPEHRKTA